MLRPTFVADTRKFYVAVIDVKSAASFRLLGDPNRVNLSTDVGNRTAFPTDRVEMLSLR